MTAILCTCFSAAYITYFYVLAAVLLLLMHFKYHLLDFARALSTDEKWLFSSTALCYVGALISAAALHDTKSALVTAKMFSFTLAMFILWQAGKKYDIYRGVKYGVYIGAAINLLGGFWQQAGWRTLRPILDPNRLQGFFGGPNTTGMVVSFTVPLLCWYGFTAKHRGERCLAALLAAGSLAVVLLTESRDAMGGLAVGAFFALLFFCARNFALLKAGFHRYWKLYALVLVSILLMLGLLGLFATKVNTERSGGERTQMITASMAMWEDHKVFGIGIARWAEYYQKEEYHPQGVLEANVHPHNVPILFLSTTGVVGCACYLLSVFATFLYFCKKLKYRGTKESLFALPIMAMFLAFVAEGMFDSTLWWKEPTAIAFWFLGTYLAKHRVTIRSGGKT